MASWQWVAALRTIRWDKQRLVNGHWRFGIDEAARKAGQSLACHRTELYINHQASVLQLGQTMRWQAKQGRLYCCITAI